MEEVKMHAIWASVIVLIIGMVFAAIISNNLANKSFDRFCVASGKSLQYRTLEGQDMAVKECK